MPKATQPPKDAEPPDELEGETELPFTRYKDKRCKHCGKMFWSHQSMVVVNHYIFHWDCLTQLAPLVIALDTRERDSGQA
jgi:hypothetical protein